MPRRSDARLVVFTATFPTGPGEAFLNAEVPYLAAGFGSVVLVPSRIVGPMRTVPDRVAVDGRWAAVYGRLTPSRGPDLWAGVRTGAWWADVVRRWPMTAHKVPLRNAMLYVRRARTLEAWVHRSLPPWPGPTLAYTYWLGPLTYGLARAKGRQPALTLVSRAHGGDLYEDRYRPPYLPLRRATLSGVDAVYPVSDIGRETLVRDRPWLTDRCVTQRLGVDDPGGDGRPSEDGVLRVVTCGGCRPVKRLDRAVLGLAALARRPDAPPVQWDHFGDGETRDAVEDLASAELGAPGANVRWTFHGHVEPAALRRHYASQPVDVLLNTSVSEGVSVAFMDAQSFGIPCVATAVGGTPEIVDDGNGRLLPPDPSPADIASALASFRPGATGIAAKRSASKDMWRRRYRAEVNYPAYVAALHGRLDAVGAMAGRGARSLREA